MAHRYYGLRATKPRHPYAGPVRADAWRGSAFIGMIAVIMIVLLVVLCGISKTVTDVANTSTSAPRTTGQGGGTPVPTPSGVAR